MLFMSNGKKLPVVGETCFSAQQKHGVCCERTGCKNWFNSEKHNNCSIIGAQNSPWTLQEIGDVYGLTRMRICQIEKRVVDKIKKDC